MGDTIALVSSPKCNLKWAFFHDSDASAYAQKCYHAKQGEDGCNFFQNQSIAFNEESGQCLFPNSTCALQNDSALMLDTGFINAKHIGINTASRLYFRRTANCAPLQLDGEYLKMNEINRIIYPKGLLVFDSDIYGRRKVVPVLDTEQEIYITKSAIFPDHTPY